MKRKKVYESIKEFLEKKGIKQIFLSEKADIPENTLSDILNGKRKLSVDEFIRIIDALDVDANYLLNYNTKEKQE